MMVRSKGIWKEGPKCRDGIRCILVQTCHRDMLRGYLEDLGRTLTVSDSGEFLDMFYSDILGCPYLGERRLSEIYKFLGVEAVYRNSELIELWWPVYVSDSVELPKTLSLNAANADCEDHQPLLYRVYVGNRRWTWFHTHEFSRELYCLYKGVSEEFLKGFEIDHHNRIPTCNTPDNLFKKTKRENVQRRVKQVGDHHSRFKGCSSNKGVSNFKKEVKLSKGSVSVAFPCGEEQAAMIYDWISVYLDLTPHYNWQIRELEEEDII